MIVPLSRAEMAACKQAAAARWQLARASGVKNQRRDSGREDGDIDLLGIKAELAVAKLFQLEYSPQAIGVDDGADMWAGDYAIDVKSTFHANGRMLFKSESAFRADLCILAKATEEEDEIEVAGGTSRKMFLRHATTQDLGHGPCLILEAEHLLSADEVWVVISKIRLGLPV